MNTAAKLTEVEYLKVFERNVLDIGRDYHYTLYKKKLYLSLAGKV